MMPNCLVQPLEVSDDFDTLDTTLDAELARDGSEEDA